MNVVGVRLFWVLQLTVSTLGIEKLCSQTQCGRHSQCKVVNNVPTCKCLPGYQGYPNEGCQLECQNSLECESHLACKNNRCVDPCQTACGGNTNCETRNHDPICSCLAGYMGDPSDTCTKFDPVILCNENQCGPNTQCEIVSNVPTCKCLPGYRVSLLVGCQKCRNDRCGDACKGFCGANAICETRNQVPICSCPAGYTGDPISNCRRFDSDLCHPSPCGPNTKCEIVNNEPQCMCLPGHRRSANLGCQVKCKNDSECESHLACRNNSCVDPCQGFCGANANCETRNHVPICSCSAGYTAAPFNSCRRFDPEELCHPSPCGPNTKCEVFNNQPKCTCLPGYQGSPIIGCQFKCRINSECESRLACRNDRCVDPCSDFCGANANCETRNHVTICSCSAGYTGDPSSNCRKFDPEELCHPSPCGPNTKCEIVNNEPKCTCLPGYQGSPIMGCQFKCRINSECESRLACRNDRCVDPCPDFCGANANCETRNHVTICSCSAGYTGDPSSNCRKFDPEELCHPSPCGPNTKCEVVNNEPKCTCLPGYQGSPIMGCQFKCRINSECESRLACRNDRCVDPCPDFCGANANCETRNHVTICSCSAGYTGDPSRNCRKFDPEELCHPSPCGPNTKCEVVNNKPKCTCLLGYQGSAIMGCQFKCQNDSKCESRLQCRNDRCGTNAICEIRNHVPICSCPTGYTGNPFTNCRKLTAEKLCHPSPCGPNTKCDVINNEPKCTCLPGYQGPPILGCQFKCQKDSECESHLACRNDRCVDPCQGYCGANANCETKYHVPICSCPTGYTGDPFSKCRKFDPEELCHPDPCGPNTKCEVVNDGPICTCLPGYHGSPISGCRRHECENNTECGSKMACIEFKCQSEVNAKCDVVQNHVPGNVGDASISCQPKCTQHSDCPPEKPACVYDSCKDPCDGVCRIAAKCELQNGMIPICSCPDDMTGDPFTMCRPITGEDLCNPNPCGANANCKPELDGTNTLRAFCTCQTKYTGNPITGCIQGDCVNSDDCPDHQICFEYKCQNPCRGQCGINAICTPQHHVPVCSCPKGFSGDALTKCHKINT